MNDRADTSRPIFSSENPLSAIRNLETDNNQDTLANDTNIPGQTDTSRLPIITINHSDEKFHSDDPNESPHKKVQEQTDEPQSQETNITNNALAKLQHRFKGVDLHNSFEEPHSVAHRDRYASKTISISTGVRKMSTRAQKRATLRTKTIITKPTNIFIEPHLTKKSITEPKLRVLLEKLSHTTTTFKPLAKFFARRKFFDTIRAKLKIEKPLTPALMKVLGDNASSLEKIQGQLKVPRARRKKMSAMEYIKKRFNKYTAKANLMATLRVATKKHKILKNKCMYYIHYILEWLSIIFNIFFKKPLQPDGYIRMVWDILAISFIIYEMFLVPFTLSFEIEETAFLTNMEFIIDVYFIVDIFLSFQTSYYKQGLLVTSRKQIALHYIRRWFWFDLIASFPYTWTVQQNDESSSKRGSQNILRILRLVRILKILRLVRIFKLKRILAKIESYIEASVLINAILGAFRLSLIILFIAHWIACAWHLIGTIESQSHSVTWLSNVNSQGYQGWYDEYVCSIYWATTTMITVGYGDITPVTDNEKIFAIFIMLIASGVFAFTMSSISNLLQQMDQNKILYKQALVSLNEYMKSKRVSPDIKIKVKRYLEHALDYQNIVKVNEDGLLGLLSEKLRNEIIIDANGKVLKTAKILVDTFTKKLLVETTMILKEAIFSNEEIVYREDMDDDCSLYFLYHGEIELFTLRSGTSLLTVRAGETFGDYSFFTGCLRELSARTKNFTKLFKVQRSEFQSLLEVHQRDNEKYCMIKDRIMIYQDLSAANLHCLCCKKTNHLSAECPTTHLVIDPKWHISGYRDALNTFRKNFKRSSGRRRYQPYSRLAEKAEKFKVAFPNLVNENFSNLHVKRRRASRSATLPTNQRGSLVRADSSSMKMNPAVNVVDQVLREKVAMESSRTMRIDRKQTMKKDKGELGAEDELFIEEAEDFEIYFPHNNYSIVIRKLINLLNKSAHTENVHTQENEEKGSAPVKEHTGRRKSVWQVLKGVGRKRGSKLSSEGEHVYTDESKTSEMTETRPRKGSGLGISLFNGLKKAANSKSNFAKSRGSVMVPSKEFDKSENILAALMKQQMQRMSNDSPRNSNPEKEARAEQMAVEDVEIELDSAKSGNLLGPMPSRTVQKEKIKEDTLEPRRPSKLVHSEASEIQTRRSPRISGVNSGDNLTPEQAIELLVKQYGADKVVKLALSNKSPKGV